MICHYSARRWAGKFINTNITPQEENKVIGNATHTFVSMSSVIHIPQCELKKSVSRNIAIDAVHAIQPQQQIVSMLLMVQLPEHRNASNLLSLPLPLP